MVNFFPYQAVRQWGSNSAKAFIHAIFPGYCLACGTLFGVRSRRPPADFSLSMTEWIDILFHPVVCPHCIKSFRPAQSPKCSGCGVPFQGGHGSDHLCGECIETPKHFRTARAAGLYDGMFRSVIHAFKYGGNTRLAAPLGRILWETVLRDHPDRQYDLILPVPLHPGRMRHRGFNQAYLLLRQWAQFREVAPAVPIAAPVEKHLLIRTKRTAPQTGLGGAARRKNLRDAFVVTHPRRVEGKTILLADDVLTTGATADACAKVLVKGGAAAVDVVTLARAVY